MPVECPLCGYGKAESLESNEYKDRDGQAYNCKRCGKFFIAGSFVCFISQMDVHPIIWAWVREKTEFGENVPEFFGETIDEMMKILKVPNVTQKTYKLMKAYERRSKYPGQKVSLDPKHDFTLAWLNNVEEFKYFFKSLVERGLLADPGVVNANVQETLITHKGWEYLAEHESQPPDTNIVFVAMDFKEEMETAWSEGIKPAIEEAGYEPIRVDKKPHTDWIESEIIRRIKESKFVVADITGQNEGVYFEAGYAMGLGRTVIITVRKDDSKNVHFDASHIRQIRWKDTAELNKGLYETICAVIGEGSKKK